MSGKLKVKAYCTDKKPAYRSEHKKGIMKQTKKNKRGILLLILCLSISLKGQKAIENSTSDIVWEKLNKEKMFMPCVSIQSWATYSMDEKDGEYKDRADISFRRFRFGAKGQPYSWLKYSLQLHWDRLGEDPYAATKGSYPGKVDIWNAFITARLSKNSELFNLHAGYFWAAISREFNTAPWAVGSFDKTRAAWYLRSFVAGKGNGIESGIALGGIKNFDGFGISYRIGTYEPQKYLNEESGRLYTGRIMFSIGQPEQKSYKYMLSGNAWKKRNGITLGVGGSTQSKGQVSETIQFDQSQAYGADILVDYEGFRLDGEYFVMKREAEGFDYFEGEEWRVRLAYNFIMGGKYLESVVCVDNYEGKGESALFKHVGDDQTWDIGVNWYMNKDKLKLGLHYLIQDGSASSNTGDFIGLLCQFKL